MSRPTDNLGDTYSEVRNPDHATLGDSAKRHRRDPDAFTAGVQYALDRVVSTDSMEFYEILNAHLPKYMISKATDILTNVKEQRL